MTTQPKDKTLSPCKQVRLSRAAASVLNILLPFEIGLKHMRHLYTKPAKTFTNHTFFDSKHYFVLIEETMKRRLTSFTFFKLDGRIIFTIVGYGFVHLLNKFLPIVLDHRYPSFLRNIFVSVRANPLVIIRGPVWNRLDVFLTVVVFVLADRRTHHQKNNCTTDGSIINNGKNCVKYFVGIKINIEMIKVLSRFFHCNLISTDRYCCYGNSKGKGFRMNA